MRILREVGPYKIKEPLFEGVRVIMTYLGEDYSPEYIQGISGAAFRISTGCPSRPTCCSMMWTTDLIRLLGYECMEVPCYDPDGGKITDKMINAVREQIDMGRPVLVWHAMTNAQWDVVCGYDEESSVFFGRGSYRGLTENELHSEPWDRAEKAIDICPAFGAVIIGEKTGEFDSVKAEINALTDAVKHARTVKDKPEEGGWFSYEGIQALRNWAEVYSKPGRERDTADAYCYDIYHSTHAAAPFFLREIAGRYPQISKDLLSAADHLQRESTIFKSCGPYLGWSSPWEANEERSKLVSPKLLEMAELYEKAIINISDSLQFIQGGQKL